MRGIRLLLATLALFVFGAADLHRPALADDLDLPGLSADLDTYTASLTKRFPAGGSPQQRQAAADAAGRTHDPAALVAALQTRIALGDQGADVWQALAGALLHRAPPDYAHAAQAAYAAFRAHDTGADQVPALLLLADALRGANRPAQAVQALEALVERAPDHPEYAQLLTDARRASGLTVRSVQTEADADPPRACIVFSVAPARREDFHAQDWVRTDPALPEAAVTREGDQICVSGLPSGKTTKLVLRAGLPGDDGLHLDKETTLAVAVANRQPRITMDSRFFVLPRGQAPQITLSTTNISAVKLVLARLSERNILAFTRNTKLGEPVSSWEANTIATDTGRSLWEGHADIPAWQLNRPARTALPLPDVLRTAPPGLYALTVTPGDGTPGGSNTASATQMILRTDLAPTVWRGSDGLTVQMRGFSDATPRPGVRLDLIAQNNDVLAQATTDADGVARFAAPLTHGTGPLAPRAVHAFGPGDDFTALDLDSASFDLSDRGVAGQPHPGPLDAFVWLDRGIYRPGETVQVMALLRDAGGAPADIPARVIVRRPNGQVFLQATPARGAEASVHLPVALSAGAAAGTWSVEVRADPDQPPIGRTEFRVDAFVPDRMAVDAGPAHGPIVPGTAYPLPVTARYLYGAPAIGLTGKATMRLTVDPEPFPSLAGFHVGLDGEAYAPASRDFDLPATDAQGHTTLPITLDRAPDTTHPLHAELDIAVNDPSGHASRAAITIPVRPATNLIGVKPLFTDAIDDGAEAGFDVAAVSPDGARVALKAKLRLVAERPDWRLVMRGGLARYETVWRDEPLETKDVEIGAAAPLHLARRLGFGRYRLEVLEAGGLAATSVRFRAGWVASENPDVPDAVDVSADRATHAPGENARIHIVPPFAGQATLLVLSDRVHLLRTLTLPAGGADVDVPVSADWGPGAYVAVHVFRPGGDPQTTRPGRAIGLVWVGVDPATRKLDLSIPVAEIYQPRGRAVIPVHGPAGAWVTLAAVDEGILRLTRFASPDPVPHFLGRRRLGLDIRDDWGRLIPPGEGQATALRQGGDEGGFALPDIPQKIVVLFTPPVQIGSDGQVAIPLDLPDFEGQVRLMAVGWSGRRIGAAQADILVRDKLVAEPLLPRFLAPGDEARLTVLLHNLDLPPGTAAVDLTVEGPLALAGPAHLAADLATGAQALPTTILRGTGAGRGVIHLDVTGPAGAHFQRETAITVRSSRGPVTLVAASEMAPGAEVALSPGGERFVPGTWHASAIFGGPVRYNAAGLVQALVGYPLDCLEQATSRGFPLAFLPDGAVAGDQRAARLQSAVASVLDRQRFDGGFALWSANGEAEPWLSAYATEFLIRASRSGAAVGEQALADALKFITDQAAEPGDKPIDQAAQAYRLYVLALAGKGQPGAARVMAEAMDRLPTPLARAQLGAALAYAHDTPRAEAAFNAALSAAARKPWFGDYGTSLRDQMAVAVLLRESGLLPDKLHQLIGALPGADLDPDMLSTQEQAWAAAAAAVLGRDGRPSRVSVGGASLPPAPVVTVALTAPAPARNLGDAPVWESLSATGVPAAALPAARGQMRVTRKFLNPDGSALDLDHLTQNTVFVLLLEGRAEDGQDHRAMLLHGLPAGWEMVGRIASADSAGMAWLGELTEPQAQPAADDRFAAVLALSAEKPGFRLAVKLRAVTPGSYELPGAELADMYRPAVFARQAAGRITVLPAP